MKAKAFVAQSIFMGSLTSIITLALMLTLFLTACNKKPGNEPVQETHPDLTSDISSITISYVSFETLTAIPFRCDEVRTSVPGGRIEIKTDPDLSQIIYGLRTLNRPLSRKEIPMNVRVVIDILKTDGKVIEVCVGRRFSQIEGDFYDTHEFLFGVLTEIIQRNEQTKSVGGLIE
jgi:hypothetical protein